MFKVPDHQVAGHEAVGGKLGPLVDDFGRFYKPLQSDERGSKEVAFYQSFSVNSEVPDNIRKFFPVFHGVQQIEASDGSGLLSHIVLQDIVAAHVNPSVMDIKIGSRTWYPQASEEYIQKCLQKDRETTSLSLGFRISGLRIYKGKESGFWKPDRKLVRRFTLQDVWIVLREFVSSNSPNLERNPDCFIAHVIYGGANGILARLLELKKWFEHQTTYHFNSCSVLMFYEKESALTGCSARIEIKLVDFAHVMDANGVIDHNFLGGLCSLIKFISNIVAETPARSIEACLPDHESNGDQTENGFEE